MTYTNGGKKKRKKKRKNEADDGVVWGAGRFEAGYAYLVVRKGPEGIAVPVVGG